MKKINVYNDLKSREDIATSNAIPQMGHEFYNETLKDNAESTESGELQTDEAIQENETKKASRKGKTKRNVQEV